MARTTRIAEVERVSCVVLKEWPHLASEICGLSAVEMARQIRAGRLSAREAMLAHLAQIERLNRTVNAIVTVCAEQALKRAGEADEAQARGHLKGLLHGVPVAHKDLQATKGVRTTFGSPIFRDFVPTENSPLVERIERAGAIMIGKTNTPEFGAGSQTFNPIFGATKNPYDRSKTCGGSSGGAAVALACRMVPLADGTDVGGSLRNPASFCHVAGLRPSAGLVPASRVPIDWFPLGVEGPMARVVSDVALFLAAMAGPDRPGPMAIGNDGSPLARPPHRDFKGVRVAWWKDLGGLPVDRRIREIVNKQRRVFESLGCIVEEAEPDLADADDIFKTLRGWIFAVGITDLVQSHRTSIKDTILWEVERGQRLTSLDIGLAQMRRAKLYQRMRRFMSDYDFFILPVSQVPPFDINQPYVTEIEGCPMGTYIDWMKSCYYISTAGNPAISVPCGFTPDGLPVGIQIVARHRDDWGLLHLAHAFEQAVGDIAGSRRPS